MNAVFTFNPETDIVLGLDTDVYTPNKNISNFRKCLSLLPALYAQPGDHIFVIDSFKEENITNLPFFNIAKAKGLTILNQKDIKNNTIKENIRNNSLKNESLTHSFFKPWGWNKEIIKKISSLPLQFQNLPSQSYIDKIRTLSHRSLTIEFFKGFNYDEAFPAPCYLDCMEAVERFVYSHTSFCLKAPWSSSGRGVVFSRNNSLEKVLEWAGGVLKSQGGVMGEKFYQKKIDFASEWIIENKKVKYRGLSLFISDMRGKYCGNRLIPQKEIENLLAEESNWSPSFLSKQKEFIEAYISPFYQGPLGFDMLVTDKGRVNPCVEINLRQTMGHVALEVEKQISDLSNPEVASLLKEYFPDCVFSVNKFIR